MDYAWRGSALNSGSDHDPILMGLDLSCAVTPTVTTTVATTVATTFNDSDDSIGKTAPHRTRQIAALVLAAWLAMS
eukprot:5687466-Amphidinium_carterae.2